MGATCPASRRRSAPAPGWAAPSSSPTCSRASRCWRTCAWPCRPRAKGAHRRGLNLWSIWSDHRALTERADEILAAVALADKENELVASLPHGDQRKLEVALLMALEPQVFMFDEPTAGMNAAEAPVILEPDPQAQERQEQDHPAGGAQDGRGARTGRPHHRAAQRHAGGRRRAGRGDRIADRAGGLPGRARQPQGGGQP